jgi:hypothetical protein
LQMPIGPALSEAELNRSGFGFSIAGLPGMSYSLERSTNLADPNWELIGTNLLTEEVQSFFDTNIDQSEQRFYRVRSSGEE